MGNVQLTMWVLDVASLLYLIEIHACGWIVSARCTIYGDDTLFKSIFCLFRWALNSIHDKYTEFII